MCSPRHRYDNVPLSLGALGEWLCRVPAAEGLDEYTPHSVGKHLYHHSIVVLDRVGSFHFRSGACSHSMGAGVA